MTAASVSVHGGRVHTMVSGEAEFFGCVLVDEGRVSALTALSDCVCRDRGAEVVDATGRTVLPGFVDGHRHTWQTAFRQGFAGLSISEYGRRLLAGIAPRFTPEDTYVGTLLGALTAIDSGTTTIVDWSHALNSPAHADGAIDALLGSGIRAQFGYGIPRDGTTAWSADSDRPHPPDIARVHHRLGADNRVTTVLAARGPEMSTATVTAADVGLARELGIRISMHIGIGDLGPRVQAVRQLSEQGLLGPDINFIHLNSTTDSELELIRDSGGSACIGPATEMLMPGVGWPVTGRLLAHGLEPALSIDTETVSSGSMFDQLRAVLSGVAAEPSPALTPADALRLATASGADAIGLGSVTGRLQPGSAGDVIVIDTGAVNLAPASDDIASIVLAGHAGNVEAVIVGGTILKRDGRLTYSNLPALVDRVRASVDRLRGEDDRRADV